MRRFGPTSTALAIAGIFSATATAIGAQANPHHSALTHRLVNSVGFGLWRGTVALCAVAWFISFLIGLERLREAARLEADLGKRRTTARWLALVLAYLAFIVLMLSILSIAPANLDIPISHWLGRVDIMTLFGVIAASPWVLLVWLLHSHLARTGAETRTATSDADDVLILKDLLYLWNQIEICILALTVLVTTAVLPTGAIRVATVPTYVSAATFPASYIVLYGAFFAVIIAFAVVPLIATWRSAANRYLDSVLPVVSARPDAEWVGQRERLQALLGLDTGVLRSPLAWASVAAPLLTSAAAAIVPQFST